jgi:hypothetical protein
MDGSLLVRADFDRLAGGGIHQPNRKRVPAAVQHCDHRPAVEGEAVEPRLRIDTSPIIAPPPAAKLTKTPRWSAEQADARVSLEHPLASAASTATAANGLM